MPDGDVFDRNVKRGWQTAARLTTGADEQEALPSVMRALGKEAKDSGCPGLGDVVDEIANAIRSSDPIAARRSAHDRLDQIRRDQGQCVTELIASSGRRVLVDILRTPPMSAGWLIEGDMRVALAAQVLAGLADSRMYPGAMLAELVEQGDVSFQDIHSRRDRMYRIVAIAPESMRLAAQLLADPSGSSVKIPRIPRVRKSQSEILCIALTQ